MPNTLYTRDLQERLDELEAEADLDEDEIAERDELRALVDEIPDNWSDGETLIHEDYFVEYAKELAEDTTDARYWHWPLCHIDWEAAADALKADYSAVEYQGATYYVRA
jgi:antirestriction protein